MALGQDRLDAVVEDRHPPHPRADDDPAAGLVELGQRLRIELAALETLLPSDHGIADERIDSARLLLLHVVARIEVADSPGYPGRVIGARKFFNRNNPAFSREELPIEVFHIGAEAGDNPHSSDYDPFSCHTTFPKAFAQSANSLSNQKFPTKRNSSPAGLS